MRYRLMSAAHTSVERLGDPHRQGAELVEQQRWLALEVGWVGGQLEGREAFCQRAQRDPPLDAGQRGADAVGDAVAEGQVTAVGAGQVQLVRFWEARRVPVGRQQRHDHRDTGRDGRARELHRLGRGHRDRDLRRVVEPRQLLDRGGPAVWVGANVRELVLVGQQCEGAVRDQAHRGVVAGDEQQLHHRGELVLGEAVVAVVGLDQRGEQVVGRVVALVLDEVAGERQHRACGGRVGLERADAAGE
jgi:hypothetical protein